MQLDAKDMDFFEHYRGNIQMCLPVDPNLCGNLEAQGRLQKMLPEVADGQERVEEREISPLSIFRICFWVFVLYHLSLCSVLGLTLECLNTFFHLFSISFIARHAVTTSTLSVESSSGGDYEWIHYATSELCGHTKFKREHGINVAIYEAVSWFCSFLLVCVCLVILVHTFGRTERAKLKGGYKHT